MELISAAAVAAEGCGWLEHLTLAAELERSALWPGWSLALGNAAGLAGVQQAVTGTVMALIICHRQDLLALQALLLVDRCDRRCSLPMALS